MGKQKAPAPPDPRETSKAQTGTSVATALANTSLGNVSRVGADGSTLDYKVSGNTNFTDPYTGLTYALPQYTATEKLSAPAQGIYDARQGAERNLADTAQNQSAFLKDYMSKPFQPDTSAVEAHLDTLARSTIDPAFARSRADLETKLSNQGIKMGSAAYDRAINEIELSQGQTRNDLSLRGRAQAQTEMMANRNQPINEVMAFLSGSQVSMPNYSVNQPSAIPTTDNAGLINANYGQKVQAWQTDQQSQQALWGGLMGLGSSAIMAGPWGAAAGAVASDRRLKTDIEKVGKTDDGQNIYKYRYKSGGPIQMGLMAQEVEKKNPDAVVKKGGIRFVDYGKALK
jgi:hypothetical protein